jgi:hypothetical protein
VGGTAQAARGRPQGRGGILRPIIGVLR